jgi:hypothetical protein
MDRSRVLYQRFVDNCADCAMMRSLDMALFNGMDMNITGRL